MKKINYLVMLFGFIVFCSCSANEDEIIPITPQAKDSISLTYEDKPYVFKNLHYGKYTNENRELIGFFVQSRIVIDDKHMNDILLYFITDFENTITFEGIEFTPFKPSPFYPYNVGGRGYQYILNEQELPFQFSNLKVENGRVTANFSGNLYFTGDPVDGPPVYLSQGVIDIQAKTNNN